VPCDTQLARWQADVEVFHPDVVLLADGEFEVRDQLIDKVTTNILSPSFAAAERKALTNAVMALGSTGATVVLLTAPQYHQVEQADGNPWPEDDPVRVIRYNSILRQVAASSSITVVVADLGGRLDPGGHYRQRVDGTDVRFADGIHVTKAGAELIAPWLLREAAALGQSARATSAPVAAPG
jgi:hypothetical protein